MTQWHVLHGRQVSLVIELPATGAPLWRYWGPRLGDDVLPGPAPGPALTDDRILRGFHLEEPPRFSVLPGGGLGWFARPAIAGHRGGRDFAIGWTVARMTDGAGRIDIALDDDVAQLSAAIALTLDPGTDVLRVETSLTNRGGAAFDLAWLASAALPLPPTVDRIRYHAGRHANEFVQQEDRLGTATWLRETRHGITSHAAFPGGVAITAATTEHAGPAYGAQLAWSGNHLQAIDWLDDGRRQWQLGIALAPGELRLAPGETVTAPAVLATCSTQGWQGVAANFHAAARAMVRWPDGAMRPRPVHFNTWEGSYFDHDEQRLMALADRAAALGVERFILDDGWFHRRDDDRRALGDWWPDARKYPAGLAPLAQHVVASGMEFGLWIEPEMVNPDSDLYRAHPDWALHLAGRPMQTSRHQLVLDLTRTEVVDHLFAAIGSLVAGLPVSYLKWDHNRDLVAAGDTEGRAAYRRQTLALHDLLDRLRSAHPGIEIESCAGGGGRIDAGMLPYVHRFWASDCLDARSRLDIQRGFLQFLPPEMMGAHVGAAPAHTTGRSQPLDFRAAVACQGHFGIELDLDSLTDDEAARLAEWVAFYKLWRGLLHAEVWSGTAADGLVWHAAGSADEWLLFVYRIDPPLQRFNAQLPLPFAAPGRRVEVSRIAPGRRDPAVTYHGQWLAQAGLMIPPIHVDHAAIFHGKAQ